MEQLTVDERAEYCRAHGIEKETQVQRDGIVGAPHPSRGSSKGYPTGERRIYLPLWRKDMESVPESMVGSLRRWSKREVPYRMTGNKQTQAMNGHHRLLLALFKKVYPHAKSNHCATFIAIHSCDGAVFTDSQISTALRDMKMTRKKASTTAYQAFTPNNLRKRAMYWYCPLPAGIADVETRDMIDADEFAIEVRDANANFGHAVKGIRVRKIGNYGRGKAKYTIIMAIEAGNWALKANEEGSIENPRIWYSLNTDPGTTTKIYLDYINHCLIDTFKPNERKRLVLHDNLGAHKSDEVADAIYERGHRVMCRPPYRPNEAPIEFAIEQFERSIRDSWDTVKNDQQLIAKIHEIIKERKGMGGFNSLFRKLQLGIGRDGEDDEDDEDDEEDDREDEGCCFLARSGEK